MLKHSFWILLPCVIFLIFIYLFIPRQTLSCIPNVGCTLEEKSVISGSINFQSFKQSKNEITNKNKSKKDKDLPNEQSPRKIVNYHIHIEIVLFCLLPYNSKNHLLTNYFSVKQIGFF